jgi:hypothetical protein
MPNMLPGAMSRREREARDAQNNWILDPGKGLAITEENANRAFGVRSPETQWTESENQRPTGFWEAYFGKKDHSKDALRARPAIETQAREKERTGFDPLGHFQPPGVADTDDTRLPFADRLRAGVLFSDTPSQSPALGTLADALDDTRRDLVREHLSFKFNPTSLSTKPEAAAAARAEQFRRILGVETPTQAEAQGAAAPKTKGAAGLAESGTGRNPLGSKDLIGVAPDPTRTELNPVVARPAPETGIGSPFSLPDSMSGLSSPRTAQRRSFLDASPIRSLQPLGANADLGSPNPTRRTTYSPTTLEIPRRSF